jgi:pimeloyl-ACP methyl ester carboxylesterase
MTGNAPTTVVLIHGLWMTALSWEHRVERYEARGFEVIARSWPGMDADVETLRRDTSGFDDLGIEDIVDHYAKIVGELDAPPIIMGHSFGGAFTQILLDRGLGAAGVAIDPAPVKGMLALPASTLRSGFPILKNPANRHRAVMLSPEEFHYSFTNTVSEDESAPIYERYAVPGPGRVLFQGALANFNPRAATAVDFKNDARAPLLLIAGGADHVSPASLTESNFKHYKSGAVTELKVFEGRSHYTVGSRAGRRSPTTRWTGRSRRRRRRRSDRDLGPQDRAVPCGAGHVEAPTERLDSIGESTKSAAYARVGAAHAIVRDFDHEAAVPQRDVDLCRGRLCVLAHVGESLGDDVIRRRLDRLRKVLRRTRRERHRNRRACGQRLERRREALVAQDRRMQPPRQLAQLGERQGELAIAALERFAHTGRVGLEGRGGEPQQQRHRHESLLRAVVKIALEPASLGVPGRHDPRSRGS